MDAGERLKRIIDIDTSALYGNGASELNIGTVPAKPSNGSVTKA